MNIRLSDHFTYQKLLRFTAPSIIMIIFISIYHIVDGLFISNFVGSTAFAAIGIVFPFSMTLGAFGFMVGTGGSALVAKTLGEKDDIKANRIFSLIVYSTIVIGISLVSGGLLFLRPLLSLLHVEANLAQNCLVYGYITIPAISFVILQFLFRSFLITAARPKFGLFITTLAGLTNILLDILFIVIFHWGLAGAAWATAISQALGAFIPLMYFILPNKSSLHLGKTTFDISALAKTYTNGVSEFISHISTSVVGTLYNYQLLKTMGENGVVAYSIIGHIHFIFLAIFLGYNSGSSPIISYHFGAKNYNELKNLFKKSLRILAVTSLILFLSAEILAPALAAIFVSYDQNLLNITTYGLRIYAISFLLVGFNIFASAFFTALNNGIVSAIISTMRIFVFESLCVIALPTFFGINGIWGSIIVAQILALMVSSYYLTTLRCRYKYA